VVELVAGKDIARRMEDWLHQDQIAHILGLWVKGLDVDWHSLYGGQRSNPRRPQHRCHSPCIGPSPRCHGPSLQLQRAAPNGHGRRSRSCRSPASLAWPRPLPAPSRAALSFSP
jgi:hypothetical protein